MTLTNYRTLGRSGLRVSPLCLGAMTFGTGENWTCDERTARALIDTYLESGGNFIDTADVYTGGLSEEILGRALTESSRREQVVLATKYTFGGLAENINGRGNGRKNAHSAIEASLRRLGTDYVDLYWMHAWDTVTPVEEIVQTFDALIRQGKIRYYGLSDVPAWFAAQIYDFAHHHGLARPIALQLEYSLIERVIEREHLPFAAASGLGLCPWSPLGGGLLSGKYRRGETPAAGRMASRDMSQSKRLDRGETWAILDTLQALAGEIGRAVAEVALAWVASRYRSTSVIVGATRVEQLRSSIASVDLRLDESQLARLDKASRLENVAPYSFFLPKRLETLMGRFEGFDPPAIG